MHNTFDTTVLLSRIIKDRHKERVMEALNNIPNNRLKILNEVFLESAEVVQKKTERALKNIQETLKEHCSDKGILLPDAQWEDIHAAIENAKLKANHRDEGFYKLLIDNLSVAKKIDSSPMTVFSPYLGKAVEEYRKKIEDVFGSSMDNLLIVVLDEDLTLRDEIESIISERVPTLCAENRNRDLKIISELFISSKYADENKIDFLFI